MKITHPSFNNGNYIVPYGLRKLRKEMLTAATARQGTECPCCGQHCKIYRRRLNHQMARFLIWLVCLYKHRKTWIHVAQFPLIQNRRGGGDYGKLIYWQLIKQKVNVKPCYKVTSGFWRPTVKGISFVNKLIRVPEAVYVYDSILQGFSDNKIDIIQALNGEYNYEELMAE